MSRPSPLPRRPLVLVVEDDAAVRTLVSRTLAVIADVVEAEHGAAALARIEAGVRPDVVVTDVMMPHLDGLALTHALKSDPRLTRVPVIVLSARTSPKHVVDGINAGVRQYVTKPFKPDDLLSKVRRAAGL